MLHAFYRLLHDIHVVEPHFVPRTTPLVNLLLCDPGSWAVLYLAREPVHNSNSRHLRHSGNRLSLNFAVYS